VVRLRKLEEKRKFFELGSMFNETIVYKIEKKAPK
jgi:hypothetical protein